MIEKDELRKKIKQLKYKIEKEEGFNKDLSMRASLLKEIQSQELSTDRIFKKINFKLHEKGMEFDDWLLCLKYGDKFNMEELLEVGGRMGMNLDREETNLLLNFIANDLSPNFTISEFRKECSKAGIRLS